MVPHRGTNWAAPWLTSQIGRDAVLSRSYGRGYVLYSLATYNPFFLNQVLGFNHSIYLTRPKLGSLNILITRCLFLDFIVRVGSQRRSEV